MKIRLSFLVLATLVVMCVGEDAGRPMPPPDGPIAAGQSGCAWLGFTIKKPDRDSAAQIPALPPGMGFVIQAITPTGPAEAAQLQPMDILWKFGDQMLVNQGQLATLLSLSKPGDEVSLALFRGGKPLDVKIKLGEAKGDRNVFSRDMIDAAILSDEGSPMKIVNIQDRTATFSNNDGKAVVRREGEGYRVVINGPDGKAIFDDTLPADGTLEGIPSDWRRRIWVLRRSLDHALENRLVPVRPPRPRVVPPPLPRPETAQPSPAVSSNH
jgi:hypothetical protein